MKVLEFLEATYTGHEHNTRKRVVCSDGFNISIQGGTPYHYCEPREVCNEYYSLELGFPSHEEPLLMHYAEDKESPLKTVYGYVPIDEVEKVIKKHGGIIGMLDYIKKERR